MRALIVDAGNSRVRAALWSGPAGAGPAWAELRLERVLDAATPADPDARAALLRELAPLAGGPEPATLVLASVVPALDAELLAAAPGAIRVDHTLQLPFGLDLADPAAVGADRLCNVAAAVARGWRDALVVDAGTATTIDLLAGGRFAGGWIAPGMALAATGLGERAARLPAVPFGPAPLEVGRSTAEAMRAGAFHVGVLGVRAAVAALLDRYGPRPVAVTGGLGGLVRMPDWLHDPDWTFQGALRLAWPLLARRRP